MPTPTPSAQNCDPSKAFCPWRVPEIALASWFGLSNMPLTWLKR
jgi:hypothetical protein